MSHDAPNVRRAGASLRNLTPSANVGWFSNNLSDVEASVSFSMIFTARNSYFTPKLKSPTL